MNRKKFLKLISGAGITIITVGAISCDNHSRKIYVVNGKKCSGCKKCIKRCHHNAIILKNNKAYIDSSRCKNCGECEDCCKRDAIIYYRQSNS